MTIRKVFDKYASRYDESRRKLIPCFDDFYRVAMAVVPFAKDKEIKVLDLGAGTGLMAAMVARQYPSAKITLMDISEKMLFQAEARVASYPNHFEFVVADYARTASLPQDYDLIISSLSIHHLSDHNKQELFKKIYAHLEPGGIFVNADQVLGETPQIEQIYREKWVQEVMALGTTDEELAAAVERMQEDRMSTLRSQLKWLQSAGFLDVNCWYKNYSFAVCSGSVA